MNSLPSIIYPPELPVSARYEEILAALRSSQVVVIAGETGSGKTTQIPKMCLEAGLAECGLIGCTQPRRVAALSVSRRVAEELKVTWGREVGCKIRFNDHTNRETRIKFMTDGILLAEIQSDPLLRGYSAIILDEAHERSLNIDFLLGYLQSLLKKRPELKLIITSATIDTELFSRAFGGAPIIEVSGRLFPVEIRYAPVESHARGDEDADELCYLEASVRATEDALIETADGDVLVFLPTERDIREVREMLEGRLGAGFEVLSLFGRMPSAEQQRVFSPGDKRRVILATNIAETSLTLPRIRAVVDTGLARISRYNPRTRTKRLPVEPISQSSANQRAGRAGRLSEGICIRLYNEEDYSKRPRFTQPEIQRANLAEVILRMKAFRLGEIEKFPFINPPQAAAIRSGYTLLQELGALDDTHSLTPIGHELARLPVDPTLGRMLLQSREEGVLEEMLIIAAGLSVPDPRERPEAQKEAAASAQRIFADLESDFLSLLKIWRAAPAMEGRGGSNALRRFCKTHFLSVTRMREWRDVHGQLADAMRDSSRPNQRMTRTFDAALHRSILCGLLGHVAQREERNLYKTAGNRKVLLFPGSGLFERRDDRRKPIKADAKVSQPAWIVAAEIVETSQLFARVVAGIDPEWAVELGAHLCSRRHSHPHWSERAGRVLALERVLLNGLELSRRHVDFGNIDSIAATEIFIRSALVAGEVHLPHRFFKENAKTREKVETALTRVRDRRAHDLDEALYRFYAARIQGVSSTHDLNRLVNARIGREPRFLCITEDDLLGDAEAVYDRALFPDQVTLGNTVLPVSYAFTPGQEQDGVTIRVPLPVATQLTSAQVQWMVPGLRQELAGVLLRALPKAIRKALMPLEPKAREIAIEFHPERGDFLEVFARFLTDRYQVPVQADDWPPSAVPSHLQPRVEILDPAHRTVAAGRDLRGVQAEVERGDIQTAAWSRLAAQWEKRGMTAWQCGDCPESLLVEEIAGAPHHAWPGLRKAKDGVDLVLFRKREEAELSSFAGLRALAECVMAHELKRWEKELTTLARSLLAEKAATAVNFHAALQHVGSRLRTPATTAVTIEALTIGARECVLAHVFHVSQSLPLTKVRFDALVAAAQKALPLATHRFGEWARKILTLRADLLASRQPYPGMEADVLRLVPASFPAQTPFSYLAHLHRYLRAVQIRAERAALSPAKDADKARQLAPFAGWENRVPAAQREVFRWMMEEFRVSLFAQELGTAQPVSAQRLQALGNF